MSLTEQEHLREVLKSFDLLPARSFHSLRSVLASRQLCHMHLPHHLPATHNRARSSFIFLNLCMTNTLRPNDESENSTQTRISSHNTTLRQLPHPMSLPFARYRGSNALSDRWSAPNTDLIQFLRYACLLFFAKALQCLTSVLVKEFIPKPPAGHHHVHLPPCRRLEWLWPHEAPISSLPIQMRARQARRLQFRATVSDHCSRQMPEMRAKKEGKTSVE